MVKAKDLKITQQTTKDNMAFGYGEFKISNSQIINFGLLKADGTIDQVKAQKVLDMTVSKALSIVKRSLDRKSRLLTLFDFNDFTQEIQEVIIEVVLAQVEGLMTDGVHEVKNGSSYSSQGVETQTDISGYLISNDRLYKAAEDIWSENQMDDIVVDADDDGLVILVDERPIFNFKFKTGQAVKKIDLIGSGMIMLTAAEIDKRILDKVTGGKQFKGDWDAKTKLNASKINTIFVNTGLTLEDGTILNTSNVSKGDSILVKATQDSDFVAEGVHWNGHEWSPFTSWNVLLNEISDLTREIDKLWNKKISADKLIQKIATGDGTTSENILGSQKEIMSTEVFNYVIQGINDVIKKKQVSNVPRFISEGMKAANIVDAILENKANIVKNNLYTAKVKSDITDGNPTTIKNLVENINTLTDRLKLLEASAATSTNLWKGNLVVPKNSPSTDPIRTKNVAHIKGDDGEFSFTPEKDKFLIMLKNIDNGNVDTETVIVSPPGTTSHKNGFSLKKTSDDFEVSIDGNGLFTLHRTAGNLSLDKVAIIWVEQFKPGLNANSVSQADFATYKDIVSNELTKKLDKLSSVLKAAGLKEDVILQMIDTYNVAEANRNRVVSLEGLQVQTGHGTKDLDQMTGGNDDKKLITSKETKNLIANKADKTLFTENSQLLTKNDTVSTEEAQIGKEYKGDQHYGESAKGTQYYGESAKGPQYYGAFAEGTQAYGFYAKGKVSIDFSENGDSGKVQFKQKNGKMALFYDGHFVKLMKDM